MSFQRHFQSLFRRIRLVVRSQPSQGWSTGSIPVCAANSGQFWRFVGRSTSVCSGKPCGSQTQLIIAQKLEYLMLAEAIEYIEMEIGKTSLQIDSKLRASNH